MRPLYATIVAISTPPGRGGIGVVRLSGTEAIAIIAPILRLTTPLEAGRARFARLLDDQGTVLDEAVVTYFAAPHSYTSEDVVEVSCHGSPVLLDYVVRACLQRGARLAGPGEFTERAFLSGRLDLTQAEAVNDLIAAQTIVQAQTAAAQLGGAVARALAPSKEQLVKLIAELEAGIDFAEDDLEVMPHERIVAAIGVTRAAMQTLADTYRRGRIVREGFSLAIVGRPNAGKSSLFNRLLRRERAIVTAYPGTTRDPVAERLSLGGIPVELVDTAGLRDAPSGPEGEAESQGIARSRMAMADADFVLLVIDAGTYAEELAAEDRATLGELSGRPHLVVLNKADLLPEGLAPRHSDPSWLLVSALGGEGIAGLQEQIVASLGGAAAHVEGAALTNLRQHEAVEEALTALRKADAAALHQLPHEMQLLDLYAALHAVDRLTGATSSEDILRLIFSTFCIGK